MMAKKTDNHNLPAKLALRRYFLRKYHSSGPAHVLDCCQGGGVLWKVLRKEFAVASYWGVDLKPRKGRLKIDSTRILAQTGWPQNVVDIDTYGSPWKHWEAMLPNVSRPTTVFLTSGMVALGGTSLTKEVKEALGLGGIMPPKAIVAKLQAIAASYCLARACNHNIIISEAIEAVSDGNACYIGVRLEPIENEQPGLQPGCSEHPIPEEEESNV
jgi:hypothetical protein